MRSPVNAKGTQAEDSDSYWGFLDEQHQLTDIDTKWPILSH